MAWGYFRFVVVGLWTDTRVQWCFPTSLKLINGKILLLTSSHHFFGSFMLLNFHSLLRLQRRKQGSNPPKTSYPRFYQWRLRHVGDYYDCQLDADRWNVIWTVVCGSILFKWSVCFCLWNNSLFYPLQFRLA